MPASQQPVRIGGVANGVAGDQPLARRGHAAAGSPGADNVFVPEDEAPPGGETAPS
jgi:hypothetical protein